MNYLLLFNLCKKRNLLYKKISKLSLSSLEQKFAKSETLFTDINEMNRTCYFSNKRKTKVGVLVQILFFLLLPAITFSQLAPNMYFVEFNDKEHNTYSLNNPSDFLSDKAIERRNKYNISLHQTDLPVSKFYIDSIKSLGFNVIGTSKWLNGIIVETDDILLLDSLLNISFVKSHRKGLSKPNSFNKELFVEKNPFINNNRNIDYGYGYTQISLVNGDYLHNQGFEGSNILISVLDAGFTNVENISYFSPLFNENRIVYTFDVVENDTSINQSHAHGTMVLSVMAVNSPGELVGTAPKASYALIRTEVGDYEYIVEEYFLVIGLEKSDSIGADLVNISLGYYEFDLPEQNYDYSQLDGKTSVASIASTMAVAKGMIVVVAAGNAGNSGWGRIGVPADADSILTIGAVNYEGLYTSFSSLGPTADGRIKPDVVAMGRDIICISANGNLATSSGTSFASPIICGLAACLLQTNTNLHPINIMEAIRKSADQYNNPDEYRGYGLPDFKNAFDLLSNTSLNNFKQNNLKIFPNPFNNQLNITLNNNFSYIKITIANILGKTVYQETIKNKFSNNIVISNLENLNKGLYIINIEADNLRYIEIFSKE